MVGFLLFLVLILQIIIFVFSLSILKTSDNNTDLILDLERNIRRIEKHYIRAERRRK